MSRPLTIETIEAHAAGEPLRVILRGFPQPPGNTVLERRRWAKEHADWLRTALMWEPRGHADMYGCLLMPPVSPGADFAVLFLHNEGFSTMCGHGIIAVTTVVLEAGLFPAIEPVTGLRIDTPAGRVVSRAEIARPAGPSGALTTTVVHPDWLAAPAARDPGPVRVERVAFTNVPSFVVALDETVQVPGIGRVDYDLAFGGAFYAYVDAERLGLGLRPRDAGTLIDTGMRIKRTIIATRPIIHPLEEDLGFLYGTIFVGPAESQGAHSRNVCVFAEGEVDRSPTGTGVSGRIAIHHARGEVRTGQRIDIESIIGTRFSVAVVDTTNVGPISAVIPEVGGSAWITGRAVHILDPGDPLRSGFLLR
ncbi:MAG: proline racemase family protein [Gemmatimonadetes bacterium]|nr:proline racemase family protein [Gemmatimonadota bacterium]